MPKTKEEMERIRKSDADIARRTKRGIEETFNPPGKSVRSIIEEFITGQPSEEEARKAKLRTKKK